MLARMAFLARFGVRERPTIEEDFVIELSAVVCDEDDECVGVGIPPPTPGSFPFNDAGLRKRNGELVLALEDDVDAIITPLAEQTHMMISLSM